MSQHDDKEGSVVVLREDIIHTAYQCRARGMTELAAQLEAMLVNAPVAPSAELRNEIIEECARECDSIRDTKVASVKERGAAIACAALIRALKNAAPQEARLPESEGGARPAQEAATRPGGTQTAPAGAAPGIPSHALFSGHDFQSDGGVLRFEAHPHGETPHVHTTCSKCGARAWFVEFQWELLTKGCSGINVQGLDAQISREIAPELDRIASETRRAAHADITVGTPSATERRK